MFKFLSDQTVYVYYIFNINMPLKHLSVYAKQHCIKISVIL